MLKLGYEGPWVFFPGQKRNKGPYRLDSLWITLQKAEKKAGVKQQPYRAVHGLRRKVSGDAFGATGSGELALAWIGDRDMRQAQAYIKDRDERMEAVREALDTERATEVQSTETANRR